MKKRYSNIKHWASIALGIFVFIMLFTACEQEEPEAGPITIDKVYLEDASSTMPDMEVIFARLGQLLRIEGSGFTGLKKVYINGLDTYFNPVFVSDNSILVTVSGETPTIKADSTVRNTIRLVNDKYEETISFEIRAAAPTITSISHTMPLEGETITVKGTGLVEVVKVVFPGNIEVTNGITSDEEGEFFTVNVPDGVSDDGGSLFVECANGGVYSPAYFNFKKGVLLDFDGNGVHGYWGDAESMIYPEDLDSVPIGTGNVSQGTYCPHRPERVDTIAPATTRCTEVWTAGNDVDDWRGQLTPYIPASTPLNEVAFQFDIYVPEAWIGTGYLKVCLVNGFNGGEWSRESYNYVPWIVDGEEEAFQTTGWTTVTIPLDKIYKFAEDGVENTFEDALATRETTSWKNFGFYFENSDFSLQNVTGIESDSETEFASSAFTGDVYTDNWRIVSLNTPVYSDFSDEDEEIEE